MTVGFTCVDCEEKVTATVSEETNFKALYAKARGLRVEVKCPKCDAINYVTIPADTK